MDECTIIMGVDESTIKQAMETHKTWKLVRPEVCSWPWMIFFDPKSVTLRDVSHLKRLLQLNRVHFIPWYDDHYHSQREKMVTGHVFVPAEHCNTEWSCKIDTDAMAVENDKKWPLPEWFEPENGRHNVMIASNWGYTRAKGGGPLKDDLDVWCETLEAFGDAYFDTPRVGLAEKISSRDHPKGPKMKMQRLASWICFQKTSWVKAMSKLFSDHCGHHTLPVPSHDTSLWYSALRSGERFQFAKMGRYGFTNRLTMKSIRNKVQEVVEKYEAAI